MVLIASLALHLYGRVRFAQAEARFEAEVGSLDFARVESPQLAEEENAATWLVAGAAAIVLSNDDRLLIHDAVNTPHAGWSREQDKTLRALVERNRGGLETLHRAVIFEQSDYGIVLPDGRASTRVPDLHRLLSAAKLLHVEARLAFADEDAARGLVMAKTLSRFSTSLTREHTVISPLVGNAIETCLHGVVAEVVGSTAAWAADPTLLAELEAILPSHDPLATTRRFLIEAPGPKAPRPGLAGGLGQTTSPRRGSTATFSAISRAPRSSKRSGARRSCWRCPTARSRIVSSPGPDRRRFNPTSGPPTPSLPSLSWSPNSSRRRASGS
ncbi:MAG: hypothetical protein GY835_11655 [bacterium]|nr:hypothetical protein [bacterium]